MVIGVFKRKILFSSRTKLRELNQAIERATNEVDVALVEELMEEKRRFLNNLY